MSEETEMPESSAVKKVTKQGKFTVVEELHGMPPLPDDLSKNLPEDYKGQLLNWAGDYFAETGVNSDLPQTGAQATPGARSSADADKFVGRFNPSRIQMGTLKKMTKDHTIALGSSAIFAPIKSVELVKVKHPDPVIAAYAEANLRIVWPELVSNLIEGLIGFGFNEQELVWKRRPLTYQVEGESVCDPFAFVLEKVINLRPDKVQLFINSETGDVGRVLYNVSSGLFGITRPERFSRENGNKEKFDSELAESSQGTGDHGRFGLLGGFRIQLDEGKFFHIALGETPENPYGEPWGAPSYQPWFWSVVVYAFTNRYYESRGIPPLVIKYPQGVTRLQGGETRNNKQIAEEAAAGFRSSSILLLPKGKAPDGSDSFEFEEFETDKRGDQFIAYLKHLEFLKLSGMLVPPKVLANLDETGSFSQTESKATTFLMSIRGLWEMIERKIENTLLKQIIEFRFGKEACDQAEIVTSGISKRSESLMLEVVKAIIQASASSEGDLRKVLDMIDAKKLLEGQDIPTKEPSEIEAETPSPADIIGGAVNEFSRKENLRKVAIEELDEVYNSMIKEVEQAVQESSIESWDRAFEREQNIRDAALELYRDTTKKKNGGVQRKTNSGVLNKYKKTLKKQADGLVDDMADATHIQRSFRPLRNLAVNHIQRIATFLGLELPKREKVLKAIDEFTRDMAYREDFRKLATPSGRLADELPESITVIAESFLTNVVNRSEESQAKFIEFIETAYRQGFPADQADAFAARWKDEAKKIVDKNFARLAKESPEFAKSAKLIKKRIDEILTFPEQTINQATRVARKDFPKALNRFEKILPKVDLTLVGDLAKDSKTLASVFEGVAETAGIDPKIRREIAKELRGMTSTIKVPPLSEIGTTTLGNTLNFKFNRSFLKQTIEAPLRETYRNGLNSVFQKLFPEVDVYKFAETQKLTGGTKSAISKVLGRIKEGGGALGTIAFWNALGQRLGNPMPLEGHGLHFGETDYWFPVPPATSSETDGILGEADAPRIEKAIRDEASRTGEKIGKPTKNADNQDQ